MSEPIATLVVNCVVIADSTLWQCIVNVLGSELRSSSTATGIQQQILDPSRANAFMITTSNNVDFIAHARSKQTE